MEGIRDNLLLAAFVNVIELKTRFFIFLPICVFVGLYVFMIVWLLICLFVSLSVCLCVGSR